MNVVLLITAVSIIAFILEVSYSAYKKDGAYSLQGTIGNLVHGIVYKFISGKFFAFYFGYVYAWYYLENNPSTDISILSFVACLILVDFSTYVVHRINHASSFFWIFHSVHHGDTKINLSSAGRISWLEQVYVLISLAPALLIGFEPYLVALVIYSISIYQFFCHSHYLKLPRFFDLLLITPSNHKIHHDSRRENQDSNYGNVFSVWDRIAGTYRDPKEVRDIKLGIKGYLQNNPLRMEIDPIIRYVKEQKFTFFK